MRTHALQCNGGLSTQRLADPQSPKDGRQLACPPLTSGGLALEEVTCRECRDALQPTVLLLDQASLPVTITFAEESGQAAYSHFRFHELLARLTMEPFAEKPIDNLASTSFCTELARGEWMRVWGCVSYKFNSIRHSQETAETAMVEKLQKPSWLRIICNALTSALRYAEVNEMNEEYEVNP